MSGASERSAQISAEDAVSDPAEQSAEQLPIARTVLEEFVRPLAISAMLTCVAISLARFVTSIVEGWPGGVFVGIVFLVSLESIQADRMLSRRRPDTRDKLRFRFVEWVVILLITRFAVYLDYGGERLLRDVSSWTTNIGAFFSLGFLINGLLVGLFWWVALVLSRTIQELETSPIERMPSVTDPGHYLRSTMPHHGLVDRQSRLNRIVSIFFAGGALLLILSGLSRVDMRELVTLQHAPSSGLILNVLAYFLLGFLLISQARYTILKANWVLQDIPIIGNLERRWIVLVLSFLLVIGIISALLPVDYSVGILDALFTAVRWVLYLLAQVAFFLLFVLSYLVGLIFSLFTGKPVASSEPMRRAAPPPPPPTVAHEPAPWWQLVRSLVFWTILMGIMGYSVYHFALDRWAIFRVLSIGRLLSGLRRFLRALRRETGRATAFLRREVGRRLASRRRPISGQRWRYISLRRLAPRDRVRYFYLSTLRRTAQQGFSRSPSATPLDYEPVLARELPAAADEVSALTEAFIEARYSEHRMDTGDASEAQRVWRRVRRALTSRKRRRARARKGNS